MKWLILTSFLGVNLLWASDPSLEVRGVTIDELDTLARQKAWSEMVFQMKDVPPAERTAKWEALVVQASIGHLDTLANEAGADLDSTASALLDEFPSLRRSPKFLEKRTEVSLAALRKCYGNPFIEDECGQRLYDLAKRESADYSLVHQAAGIVEEKESPAAGVPFLKLVLHKGNRDKLCRDEVWQKAVFGGLGASEGVVRRQAREIASQDCWPVLKDKLVAEMNRQPSSVAGICEVLKEKNGLTGDKAKLCATKSPLKTEKKP